MPRLRNVSIRVNLPCCVQAVSGGAGLDAKIAQFEEDIDAEMLKMLEQRITAASKVPAPLRTKQ